MNCLITPAADEYAIEKKRIALSFSKAASSYDEFSVLQKKVADSLIKNIQPNTKYLRILDLGCGTAYCTQRMKSLFPHAEFHSLDIAGGMLERARINNTIDDINFTCGDIEALPFAQNSFDLIVSNLTLQWCRNLRGVFREIGRVLKQEGHCFLSTLGPRTLGEIRDAWQRVDSLVHVNNFIDSGSIKSVLLNANFSELKFREELLCLHYEDSFSVLRELKAIGAHNMNSGQAKGLTGKKVFARFNEEFNRLRSGAGLPVTYQAFYINFQNS